MPSVESSRRTVLRTLAATVPLGVAGCAGTADEATPRTSESDPCDSASPPTPTDNSYPDQPGELTEQSAREYALAYERAYQRVIEPGYMSLVVDTGPEVTATENGYLVQFVARLETMDEGVGTATAVPGTQFYTAQYAVTDAGVWRAEAESVGPLEENPTPTADGRAMACF
jgi:hypothetical protein